MGPNRKFAIKRYRKQASGYDKTMHCMEPVTEQLIKLCKPSVATPCCRLRHGRTFSGTPNPPLEKGAR